MNTKYLGIDFGEKRIGIAITDENRKYSFSRDYIDNNEKLLPELLNLIKNENVSKIILGYPLNLKSEKTVQTLKTEEFKNKLTEFFKKNSLNTEILFYDERFSSRIAESGIINSNLKRKKRREKGLVDSLSAQIILKDYLDKLKNESEKL